LNIKANSTTSVFSSMIKMVSDNILWILGTIIIVVLIEAVKTTALVPEVPEMSYDCTSLSNEQHQALTSTINTRLEMIKLSMNSSLRAGNVERSNMRNTIKQIMNDTKKEFCKPILPTMDIK